MSPKLIKDQNGEKLFGLVPRTVRKPQQWKLIDSEDSYAELIQKYESERNKTKKLELLNALFFLHQFNTHWTQGTPLKNLKLTKQQQKETNLSVNASRRSASTIAVPLNEALSAEVYSIEEVFNAIIDSDINPAEEILSKTMYLKLKKRGVIFSDEMHDFYERLYGQQEVK